MNIASIDIGSNTVLLLITKVDNDTRGFETVINRYEAPRLGRGLKVNGDIADESIQKLLLVLKNYKQLIIEHDCEVVICTATNAMRVAKNSDKIKETVKLEYEIDIEIIAGEREAELSFLGAATTLPDVKNKIVMDIGGGSTEIIYGESNDIKFKKSFPVGAVNLTEMFINNEIPAENEIDELSSHIKNVFAELNNAIPGKTPLIAVAGTPTSLSAINMGLTEYDEKKIEGSVLTTERINSFVKEFSQNSPNQILKEYGKLIRGREDVILAGSLILRNVAELTENKKLFVSGRGIRYGSVIDYLNKL